MAVFPEYAQSEFKGVSGIVGDDQLFPCVFLGIGLEMVPHCQIDLVKDVCRRAYVHQDLQVHTNTECREWH